MSTLKKCEHLQLKEIVIKNIRYGIKTRNYELLKRAVQHSNFKLRYLKCVKNFDILIYSIKRKTSIKIIKFIIDNANYKNLNYTLYNYCTPLACSLEDSNYKVATYLIQNKCDVNYTNNNKFNIVNYLINKDKLNDQTFNFLINNNLDYNLVKQIKVEYLDYSIIEYMLKNCIYNNKFIISMIKMYKNGKTYSNRRFIEIISYRKRKFDIPKDWYIKCILCEKYTFLELFLYYEGKTKFMNVLEEEIDLLNSDDMKDIYEFIIKIERRLINIQLGNLFLNDYKEKILNKQRNILKKLIMGSNQLHLSLFLSNNLIYLKEMNSSSFDILSYAIKNNAHVINIKILVERFKYRNINYLIPKTMINEPFTTIELALANCRFDIVDFLLFAYPDEKLKFLKEDNISKTFMILFENNKLNESNLNYIYNKIFEVYNNIESNFINLNLIEKLIEKKNNILALYIIRIWLLLNKDFNNSWYRIALEANNYIVIDNLYLLDKRESKIKLKILLELAKKSKIYLPCIYNLSHYSMHEEIKKTFADHPSIYFKYSSNT